jgi:hypothetical protein
MPSKNEAGLDDDTDKIGAVDRIPKVDLASCKYFFLRTSKDLLASGKNTAKRWVKSFRVTTRSWKTYREAGAACHKVGDTALEAECKSAAEEISGSTAEY